MVKLVGRLIGFGMFMLVFGCAGAFVLLVSLGAVDVRALLPGASELPPLSVSEPTRPDFSVPDVSIPDITLPDNIDPSALPDLSELPELPQLPEITAPEVFQPGEPVVLARTVTRRPLTAQVPAPQQVSAEPEVVGTNMFYAILMALIFGATSTMLGDMLRDEEPRIRAWLRAMGIDGIFEWIGQVFNFTLGRAVQRGCLTLPIVVAIFALYGVIFAFLEEGTSILTREGAFLAVMMAFTVGLVSFSGDIARRIAGRIWHRDSRFQLYPINLGIAVVTVALSRLLNLSPGIAFGTPGGAEVELPPEEAERREAILALLEMLLVVALGAAGWAVSGTIFAALGTTVDGRVATLVGDLPSAAQNAGLAIFFVALETAFFGMLPLAYSAGRSLLKWHVWLWAALFVPLAFLFNHTLLNPQSGFLDSFMVSNVRAMWILLFGLVAVTAGLWFYFNVLDDVLQEWAGIAPRRAR